jgi:hypothetical protein
LFPPVAGAAFFHNYGVVTSTLVFLMGKRTSVKGLPYMVRSSEETDGENAKVRKTQGIYF